MKIFLANLPWRMKNRLGVRAGSRWPFIIKVKEGTCIPPYVPFPFLLAYAAAVLEKNGFNVLLVDAIAEGLNEPDFLRKIQDYQPDIILFETSTPSIDNDLRISQQVKNIASAKLTLCGPHVSVFKEETLKIYPFIDYILEGEYEYTLLELTKSLQLKKSLDGILGLTYRDKEGKIKVNPRRPAIENLDEFPWPARHFLSMHNYNDAFCDLPTPSLQMWTSRGCPYRCIFCLWPEVVYGNHRYRIRDPKDVVDEMGWCIEKYGFKSVYFDDDTFNIKREHVLDISREIKKRKLGVVWAAMCRADNMDKQMLEIMKDSGLYAVKYGIESGSQNIVNNCGKKLDLKEAQKTVRLTKELGIKVHLTFTFGLPGETRETIKEAIKFATDLDPNSIQFSLTTPFPGTEYFKIAKEKGLLLTQDWSKYDGEESAVIRTEKLSKEELEKALIMANKLWTRHILWKNFSLNKFKYFKKAFCHPVKAVARLTKLFI